MSSVRRETPATRIVRAALGDQRFPFRAGQAALIGPADCQGRAPFSLACAPEDARESGTLEFLIKTDASGRWGDGFPELRRGMRLALRGPVGSFVFPDGPAERRFLFIAGGTGVAPLRAMIRHVLAAPRPGRLGMLYSARTPADFAYARELRGLARRGELDLVFTASREAHGRWRGSRGRIAADSLASLVQEPATRCFVCGPTAMVADVPLMLAALGIRRERIHVEQWAS